MDPYSPLIDAYGYGILSQLTHAEIASIALYQIKLHRNVSPEAHLDYAGVIASLLQKPPPDIRTVQKLLERVTGKTNCDNESFCLS
jgi:hypothetical protein